MFQSLAAAPFLPRVDLPFVEHHWHVDAGTPRWPVASEGVEHVTFLNARWEGLGSTSGWPPPPHVTAVLLGFRMDHFRMSAELTRWLREQSHAFAIGTRDGSVADGLRERGVRAFLSGDFLLGMDSVLEPRRCPPDASGEPAVAYLTKRPFSLDIHDCARRSLLCNRTWRWRLHNAIGDVEVATWYHAYSGQKGGRDDTWPPGGKATEFGVTHDLLDRAQRQQLAWNRLRAMRDVPYILSGPTPYFHTLIPAAGLGTPALDISSPSTTCHEQEANETRFVGLSALVDDLYSGSCRSKPTPTDFNASLQRLLARSACASTALSPDGLKLKRSLVAEQRRAVAARHPSLLDAMNRLGLAGAEYGTREDRDAAWLAGRWVG